MTVRREDDRLLRGRGRFVDDVDVAGQGHARVVRSQDPHARLLAVDTTAARAMPGVRLAASAADLPGDLRIPVRIPITDDDLSPNLQPVLASDRVRYVGEPVAVVVADDPYRAEDAAERVRVRTEALPPVIDPTRAAEAAPLRAAGNVAAGLTVGYGAVDEAFAGAAATVHLELDVGRHAAVPLETRGLLAAPADEGLELWGWTKVPHYNRRVLAGMLGLPVSRVRLHGCDAGGGFGARGEFYPEDFLVPWAALATGAPVKWVEDRGEHLVASNHSREQRYALSAAFDDGGLLAGLRAEVVHDNGAYVRTHGASWPSSR